MITLGFEVHYGLESYTVVIHGDASYVRPSHMGGFTLSTVPMGRGVEGVTFVSGEVEVEEGFVFQDDGDLEGSIVRRMVSVSELLPMLGRLPPKWEKAVRERVSK